MFGFAALAVTRVILGVCVVAPLLAMTARCIIIFFVNNAGQIILKQNNGDCVLNHNRFTMKYGKKFFAFAWRRAKNVVRNLVVNFFIGVDT
ncbi:MAG: hypothetical protein A3F17_02115 [Gammaproteobacteria bacterium RIFCSPHIGHO2_12_FULL_41_15]|nr:MAG: hypothetical protein A3F17_02115 [Gammaproteobacteria bacterium RIFCSPHIGHO2_12_FULL_41_15]